MFSFVSRLSVFGAYTSYAEFIIAKAFDLVSGGRIAPF